jgi:hypothetical protein
MRKVLETYCGWRCEQWQFCDGINMTIQPSEELDKMGQVRSMNGTVQTLVRMTVAYGRGSGFNRQRPR